ncbi:hypothetical protein E2C01_036619 [Portunus trituberculatus]|uniref:Uncharacterized protein n=1 Tax=Portunus trituberculatus TaxID=210409 RepID=A0A5B7FET0_PORTR|nr:hypothetical protein [Portunus trituberculatus]
MAEPGDTSRMRSLVVAGGDHSAIKEVLVVFILRCVRNDRMKARVQEYVDIHFASTESRIVSQLKDLSITGRKEEPPVGDETQYALKDTHSESISTSQSMSRNLPAAGEKASQMK